MKKNMYKVLAAAFAMALVMTSPVASVTSLACSTCGGDTSKCGGLRAENEGKDADHGTGWFGEANNPQLTGGGSSDSGSSESAPSYDSGSSNDGGGSYGGGSSDNGGSGEDSYIYYSGDSGSTDNSGSSDNSGSGDSGVTYAPTRNPNDVVVCAEGCQKFRSVGKPDRTGWQVFHCGISRAAVTFTDAAGKEAAFQKVALEKGDDGLWYVNFTFAEGVDASKLTLNVVQGDATYLGANLGVSGIKLNGTLVQSTVQAK